LKHQACPDAAAAARNSLLALVGRVEDRVLNDVRLLVSEVVSNSVRHSNIALNDIVHMRLEQDPDRLRVEVLDAGQGFDPKPRDLDRERPGGWGLYLVDRLADRWGVDRGPLTRVWFEIDTAGRQAPSQEVAA
jgi:anti-sigma regulatory factor (Ser/Thr protein kinase)